MIKRLIFIFFSAYAFFILEVVLDDLLGIWAKPELMLLLVIFWGLYSGIRYSIVAAVLCGILKDSFSILPFGTYFCVFIAAAYLTTLVRQNLYQPGSRFSRAVVAFFVLVGVFTLEVMLYQMSHDVRWYELLSGIFLPQLVTTMIAVTFVFHRLRDIAVRLRL